MSSACITIGGLDVSPYSGESVVGAQPAAESQDAASVERRYDGDHVPVILTVESATRPLSAAARSLAHHQYPGRAGATPFPGRGTGASTGGARGREAASAISLLALLSRTRLPLCATKITNFGLMQTMIRVIWCMHAYCYNTPHCLASSRVAWSVAAKCFSRLSFWRNVL